MKVIKIKFVEPIRDEKKIEAVKRNLLDGNHYRDYLLFTLGINTGLRVSDLLKLKYTDVLDDKGKFKSHITIKEKKTGNHFKFGGGCLMPICFQIKY
jgi:integrase